MHSNESQQELASQMEAILFAAGEPVGVEQICKGLDLTRPEVDAIMEKLISLYEFERRGIRILRLDTTYQMCSAPEYASTIRSILETRVAPKLSQPAIEVLAIIAYHQPTTRTYVDQVRGVDSAYTVSLLLDRGLIEECGKKKDVPGRPTLYRTTKTFLRSFHMNDINDLPDLGQPEPENIQTQQNLEQRMKELEGQEVLGAITDGSIDQPSPSDEVAQTDDSTEVTSEESETDEKGLDKKETDKEETDENETDEVEADENETDEDEADEEETDEEETDKEETDEVEADENETDEVKADENEADEDEADEVETDEDETDEDETDEDETDEDEADEDEAEADEDEADEDEADEDEADEDEADEDEADEVETDEDNL